MNKKTFYILTLGIGYIITKNKIKKINNNKENNLVIEEKIKFDINDLLTSLGNKENIINIDSSISTLKIKLKDIKRINEEEIKKLKISGIFINDQVVNIRFGNNAKTIEAKLKELV